MVANLRHAFLDAGFWAVVKCVWWAFKIANTTIAVVYIVQVFLFAVDHESVNSMLKLRVMILFPFLLCFVTVPMLNSSAWEKV